MKVSVIVLIISTLLTSTLAYMVWNKDQTQDPVVTQKKEAELILQVDSCKVYHFYSNGHDVYMAVKGNSVSISR